MSEEELEDLKWQQTEYEENIIGELVKENEQLKSQLQQKDNIIKEAIEYIKANAMFDGEICCDDLYTSDCDKLIKILEGE